MQRATSNRKANLVQASVALTAACLVHTGQLAQADVIWLGAESGDWSNAANWSPNPPANSTSTDFVIFNDNPAVTESGNTTINVASQSIWGIQINSGELSYTIGTEANQGDLTVGRSNASVDAVTITSTVTAPQIINSRILLNNSGSGGGVAIKNDGKGGLTLSGNIYKVTSSNGNTLTFSGSGNTYVAGRIGRLETTHTNAYYINKAGEGTVTFANTTSSYSGYTRVSGGTLQFARIANAGMDSSLGNTGTGNNVASQIQLIKGTLEFIGTETGYGTTNRLFTLASASEVTVAASGTVPLQWTNSGAIGTAVTNMNTDGSTPSGSSTIKVDDASRLSVGMTVGGSARLAAGTTITAIDLATNTITISVPTSGGSISDNTGLSFTGGSRSLTLGGTSVANNFVASVIENPSTASGAVPELTYTQLRKAGTGTWTLTGVNTYTGSTTISAGTLKLAGAGSIASSSSIAIASGATFDVTGVAGGYTIGGAVSQTLTGRGTVNGDIVIGSLGTLKPGESAGLLTFNGALELGGTLEFEIEGTARGVAGGYDAVDVSGPLTWGGVLTLNFINESTTGTVYDLFALADIQQGDLAGVTVSGFYGGAGTPLVGNGGIWTGTFGETVLTFSEATGDLTVSAVPEPAAIGLLGLAGLALGRRKRS